MRYRETETESRVWGSGVKKGQRLKQINKTQTTCHLADGPKS